MPRRCRQTFAPGWVLPKEQARWRAPRPVRALCLEKQHGLCRHGAPRAKSLFLQKKSCFFEKKPLQRAFSYYIILLLRSAQYGMRQKVAGGHFRVISADNRPTIGRSKGQMPEKRGAFALKNSYGTHGSVCKGAMMQVPAPARTQPVVGRQGKAARGATLAKEE